MFAFKPLRKFRDISISKKLYFVVGTMAVLIAAELFTLWFSIRTLSSVRALVAAEGLWSKAQKDGLYHLQRYSLIHDEEDYIEFWNSMKVPLGDHKTRLELMKPNPDLTTARKGFLEGRNSPEDIDGMIRLLQRFHWVRYLNDAINLWAKGDSILPHIYSIASNLHDEIHATSYSQQRLDSLVYQMQPLNKQLTVLEDNFSYTLGAGSRWLENSILKLLLLVALTVEITGLVLSVYITRGLTRGLNEINKTTSQIAKGDLSAKAKIFSADEIGQLADAVNKMTERLIASNNELAHFAYIASHDLQEPLRTISNFVRLLGEDHSDSLDGNATKYLHIISGATFRMQTLIKDLLDYSRLASSGAPVQIDCSRVVADVINDLSSSIRESHSRLEVQPLPVIKGYPEIRLLFQNLLSNAIKFRKPNGENNICISCTEDDKAWIFSIRDNGIGIEQKYFQKIFTIFQKLHSHREFPGSGIGLAQCQKVVDLHSGRLWVESGLGKGSTFRFSIPKQMDA